MAFNIDWFIISVLGAYASLIYKREFISKIKELRQKQIIDEYGYSKAIKSLGNRKSFVIFLIVLELSFFFWWYGDFQQGYKFRWDLIGKDPVGIFLAIGVQPLIAETYSAYLASILLPLTLKGKIGIDIFSFDKHGGLKSYSYLLLLVVSINFIGIGITYVLFPWILLIPIYPISAIAFGVGIFLLPQFVLHQMLDEKRNQYLSLVQSKITFFQEQVMRAKPESSKSKEESDNLSIYASYISNYKAIKDDIESVGTWPFDWKAIYKLLIGSTIPAIPFIAAIIGTPGAIFEKDTSPLALASELAKYTITSASQSSNYVTAWNSPFISLNPLVGKENTTVQVSGTGFTPNASVTLKYYYDGDKDKNPKNVTTTTDSSGTFNANFKVPSSNFGEHQVQAIDNKTRNYFSRLFILTNANITLNPTSPMKVVAGSTVTINGTGFTPNSPLIVKYNGNAVPTTNPAIITANAGGEFVGSFAIPQSSSIESIVEVDDSHGKIGAGSLGVIPNNGVTGFIMNSICGNPSHR